MQLCERASAKPRVCWQGNQSRMIKHFHFMRWPDHGCPEKTAMLLNFVSSVRAHMPHSGSGPMLVHCR